MAEVPSPQEEILLTHFIVSDDVERSRRFYTEVLGGRVAFSNSRGPTNVALSNSWIVINAGGGPTDDKPEVTLETPSDPNRVSSFVNIRVKDMEKVYSEWSARGAQFLTPPKQHQYEIRCYIRDPDGHLIEVGQTTDTAGEYVRRRVSSAPRGNRAGPFHRVRRCRAFPALLHRCPWRQTRVLRTRRTDVCPTVEQLGHHQRGRGSDR
jgi:catechol 2,3-dioxygenase-like lactoylglutathione lyase family enzyme